MQQSDASPNPVVLFGEYELRIHERRLLRAGVQLDLGDRAFDVLLVLLQSQGRAVSKDELMCKAWPDRSVGENALQAQITALRRVFGPDRGLIVTVSGRGYHFAAPLRDAAQPPSADSSLMALPQRTQALMGRDRDLDALSRLIRLERLVTLVGVGGVGKTQLGIELARRLAPECAGGAQLIELAQLDGAGAARAALAAAVGDKPGVLVLDGCERWIALAADLAESALRANRAIRLVATSREPLRAEGESVYRLSPLELPGEDEHDVDATLKSPAVQLFLARLAALGEPMPAGATSVRAASLICRALDGVPLAIEMAAARAARVGLDWVLSHLEYPLAWLTHASRTAPERQRSVQITLDQSAQALSAQERSVLKRVGEFSAPFSLDEACAILQQDGIGAADVLDRLSDLVDKSLVERFGSARMIQYRLLRLVRAYAREMS
jgi:predicted ATPase/DNA-binding winged helix-turn-helix (wHTH) protein